MVLSIALPIMIQNGFTNFVNLLDNLMVGRVGTMEMSGVSITNQLLFVFNLCVFGGMGGAGIFSSQYFGAKDDEGVKRATRYKILLGILLIAIAYFVLFIFGDKLISLFLKGDGSQEDKQATLLFAKQYLLVMLLGLPGFTLSQIYSTTLREGGETVVPMRAGIIAILTNLCLNWVLIYGHLGFKAMGVVGAAIATVISRYIEAAIVMIEAHSKNKYPYFKGLWKTLILPRHEIIRISKAAAPLLMNETMWSLAMTFLAQCYSLRGLNAVAGYNIASTMNNFSNVTFLAVGNAVGIIVGQLLGAGKKEEAVDTDRKMIVFAVFVAFVTGLVICSVSKFFPLLYNTTREAQQIGTELIMAQAILLPLFAYKNSTYFTLRSGGMIWVTILFDSAFMWAVSVPIAFFVSRYTSASVLTIFLSVQAGDIPKCILGYILVKKQIWVNRIVD